MYQIPCKTEGEHAKMSQMPCKMTDSSSKLLQTPGKWHQERNNKKNQTSPKKLKLFFTPFKYDRRYFCKKSSLFNAGGWNTCLFGYHVALCVHSDDYVDCLPWLPSANHFRGLNMHPKLWKVQQWTSRNYRNDPKLWKSDLFDWFSLNLWISMDMDIYGHFWSFLARGLDEAAKLGRGRSAGHASLSTAVCAGAVSQRLPRRHALSGSDLQRGMEYGNYMETIWELGDFIDWYPLVN